MSAKGPSENQVIHEVDGIQEYDNQLPNWWLYLLYGSIAFAACYWFYYHSAAFGELPLAEHKREMEAAAAADIAKLKAAPVTAEALITMSKDSATLAQGKTVFVSTCAACHRQDGGGVIGPNLTDEFWLHGGAPEAIYKTVTEGVADKAMPAWGPQLGPDKVKAVTAYVLTLRGTNVAGGKAPQGEREAAAK